MPNKVRITNECMSTIRAAKRDGADFKQTGTQQPNGDWDVEIEEETFERILGLCTGGESVSDAILLAFAKRSNSIN